MLHVTLRPPHFPRLFTPQRTQCKGYSKYAHKVHIALLCDIFLRDKKSWKIFVILFGGIKNSPYLCRRFSGTTGEASLRASSRLRSLAKSLHPATRPAERLHRGAATGIPTTEARDKQIAASVLSYHRQGPLLREGQERTKGEERACVRDERRTEREDREEQREKREERRTISITFKTLNAMINHSITARAVSPNLFEGSSFRPPTRPRP